MDQLFLFLIVPGSFQALLRQFPQCVLGVAGQHQPVEVFGLGRILKAIEIDMASQQRHEGTPRQNRIPFCPLFRDRLQLTEQFKDDFASSFKITSAVGLFSG